MTPSTSEIRILAHGMLGYGFPEASLRQAIESGIDVIAIDAGSTDIGPYYLGADVPFVTDIMVARDLTLLIEAAVTTGARLLIGSAGGSGTRAQTEHLYDLVLQIADAVGFKRRIVAIDTELPAEFVIQALQSGEIEKFESPQDLRENEVRAAAHIVAQMGVEPYVAALEGGADLIVGGRSWDVAPFAAVPVAEGFDKGLACHLGKILECGAQAAIPVEGSDLLYGRLLRDHFTVEALSPAKRCTIHSVAAHTLYEKQNPFVLLGPGGTVDLTSTSFEQADERRVVVTGSQWHSSQPYKLKLEGARLVGHRHISIGGIRDPRMIAQLPKILPAIQERLRQNLGSRVSPDDYSIVFREYGIDGVMGDFEPKRQCAHERAHEVGLVIDVVASSPSTAESVCALARSLTMHWAYEGRIATAGNLAVPFSPADFPAPPVYEFTIYHLMAVDELSRTFSIWSEDRMPLRRGAPA